MGVALWLSVWNLWVPRGQAVYVAGLATLLLFAAVEFPFFIVLMTQRIEPRPRAMASAGRATDDKV